MPNNFSFNRNSVLALNKLLDTGCETVIITLGEKGAVYAKQHDRKGIHVLTENVNPVDTTVSKQN